MMREYRSLRAYEEDARRLCKSGWAIVSTIDRPAPPDWLERTTRGLSCLAFPPGREYLVTYTWQAGGRQPLPDLSTTAGRTVLDRVWRGMDLHYWWWTLAILILLAILLYGVLGFFAP